MITTNPGDGLSFLYGVVCIGAMGSNISSSRDPVDSPLKNTVDEVSWDYSEHISNQSFKKFEPIEEKKPKINFTLLQSNSTKYIANQLQVPHLLTIDTFSLGILMRLGILISMM